MAKKFKKGDIVKYTPPSAPYESRWTSSTFEVSHYRSDAYRTNPDPGLSFSNIIVVTLTLNDTSSVCKKGDQCGFLEKNLTLISRPDESPQLELF
jgi:hypothetical protein